MDEENENLEELENESTPNNENIPGEIEAEPPKNELLAVGAKNVIDTLLKINPWWWLFLGLFVFVVLFLILMISINQASGGNDLYYKEGVCTTVTVKYEPYNEKEPSSTLQMDMETYVQSAAIEYMKDLIEHEDETAVIQVYYALTIALRTEAVSNNCTVTYRDKQLSKNPGTNAYLDVVLKESKGVILGDENHNVISSAHVSDFCWYNVNDNQEEYKIYPKDTLSVSNDFVKDYVANEIYKKCPCNAKQGSYNDSEWRMCWTRWPINEDKEDEEPEYEYAWLHDDDETGFSVVGAYNLMRTKDYNYNLILKYFYGEDIIYMTMNKETQKNSSNFDTGGFTSSCSTSSSSANLLTFVNEFEGGGNYLCSNGAGYLAKNLKDSTITIGHGVTNHDFGSAVTASFIKENGWEQYFHAKGTTFYLNEGDCVPISIIDEIEQNSLANRYAAPIDAAATKYNVTLTQYQKDAITSFNYNLGEGHTDALIKAYAEGGLESLWAFMKQYRKSQGEILSGLMKRRKAEFALFVTGDYTDQGKFYSRAIDDYDNYDSEGVVSRKASCSLGQNQSGFMFPLPSDAIVTCTSPYGFRVAPTVKGSSNHAGLDLAVAGGTNIYAAKSGTVIETRNDVQTNTTNDPSVPSSGNYVKIKHEDGTMTAYLHMKPGSVTVNVGDTVNQGDKIGEVGTTGASTGYHLHFTVYDVSGATVDPYDYLDLSNVTNPDACHHS